MKEDTLTIDQALENVGTLVEQTAHGVDWKYVKRPDSQIERIAHILSGRSSQQKFLLAGQDGCGKTTELNRLEELVSKSYTVVRCDHRHFHDLNSNEEIEFLFVLIRAFMSAAEAISPKIQERIVKVFEDVFQPDSIPEFELKASILGLTFSQKVVPKKEDLRRESSIREEFGMFRAELNSIVHKAIEEIQSVKDKPVLLIVDDLEKFQYERVYKLVTENYQILSLFPCAIVYTVPLWLLFDDKRTLLEESFHISNLANIPSIDKRDKLMGGQGRFFDEIATRRMRELWTDLEMNHKTVTIVASGGHLRQFLSLLRSLLLEAFESPNKKIEIEHIEQSIIRLMTGFRRILNPDDRKILKNVRNSKEYNYSLPRRLLQNYSVLEYRTPDLGTWYDVNPMALPDEPSFLMKKLLNGEDVPLA